MAKRKREGGHGYHRKMGNATILTYGPPAEADVMKKAAKIDGRSLRAFVWVHALKAALRISKTEG